MCAEGHRPICQDTGIVNVFLKVGMDVRFEGFTGGVEDVVNEGVRRAYNHPDNTLRASIAGRPAVRAQEHQGQHAGRGPREAGARATRSTCIVAAKGGGSENKSQVRRCSTRPTRIVDWVLKTVPTMGAGWCPPGMLGIGIGGTAEKAMLLAKEALMEPIDMYELQAARPAATRPRSCASSCTTRSTRSASARRAWAA